MKDIILDKIDQLIAEARKDSCLSATTRTEVVNYLAELKAFAKHQTV